MSLAKDELKKIDFLQTALHFRSWGWSTIPVVGKNAHGKWKQFQTVKPTDYQIFKAFGWGEPTGVAVILGSASGGLACRDFDTVESYSEWAANYPKLAVTLPTVQTARGFQVYFRSNREAFLELTDGEFRADSRHYCLIPPSLHPSGTIYEWSNGFPAGPSAFPMLTFEQTGFLSGANLDLLNCRRKRDQDKANNTNTACAPRSDVSENDLVWEVVQKTIPHNFGQRSRRLFLLARHLKAIPSVASRPVERLFGIVRRWHFLAIGSIKTKEWEKTWADFLQAWKASIFPIGEAPIDDMVIKAANGPTHKIAEQFEDNEIKRLISVCACLQELTGDKPFYLSIRSAQKWASIGSNQSAMRRLTKLVDLGILQLVKRGSGGTMQRVASEYRFIGG